MPDHVIDTNVLLVASAADPYSPFGDTHVPMAERQVVLDWLCSFRSDTRALVLDSSFRIYQEYRKKLSEQDLGLLVVHDKLTRSEFRQVPVTYVEDGAAVVPKSFRGLDRSDRKFLAAALADGGRSTIVNAADTDWLEVADECSRHGVVIEELIGPWLRGRAER